MYSFGNRTDCAILDEPFYAAYLNATGALHPMREDILASQPTDPDVVVETLVHPNRGKKPIVYQKHMTHHILPDYSLDWMKTVRNVFLIRDPRRILASYLNKRAKVGFEDLGFAEQIRLFEFCMGAELDPIVLDSDDLLRDPGGVLRALCTALGIEFQRQMLEWPKGPRKEDGVWARHWYDAVHQSTEFGKPPAVLPPIQNDHQNILDQALPIYDQLRQHALRVS